MGNFDLQEHDFEPGIAVNGLFWTIPLGNGMLDADPTTGVGRFRGMSVKVNDYGSFFNAVAGGKSFPSRVDFDVLWAGGGGPATLDDKDFEVVGDYELGPATIAFTAFNEHGDVVYTSDPDLTKQTNPDPAGIGRQRNGVFFG